MKQSNTFPIEELSAFRDSEAGEKLVTQSKAEAANMLFDLESGTANEYLASKIDAASIFRAVIHADSLVIDVDGVSGELFPYYSGLDEETVIEILADTQTAIQASLLKAALTATASSSHFPLSLVDAAADGEGEILKGWVETNNKFGAAIHLEGYRDSCSDDTNGTPVYIEIWDGNARVLVYSNINEEEPTHIISLAGAKIENRHPDD